MTGQKCSAHSKATGEPCKAWAIKGGTVCVTHGGASGQVKRAAKRRRALAAADRLVQRAGVDADPIEHLVDSLHQAAQLAAIWGLMSAALDAAGEHEAAEHGTLRGEIGYREADSDDGDEVRVFSSERLLVLNQAGFAQVHPFVLEYQRAIERRARLAKQCIDAGVDQARVELRQAEGALIADIFRAVFADDSLGLSADQRRSALAGAAKHMRLIAGGRESA